MTYCTQNDGDCNTCSLVNYGRDCHNNPVVDLTFEDGERIATFNEGSGWDGTGYGYAVAQSVFYGGIIKYNMEEIEENGGLPKDVDIRFFADAKLKAGQVRLGRDGKHYTVFVPVKTNLTETWEVIN